MRILKAVQAYHPFREKGGPIVKVRALARALTQRGHEVSVLTADLGLADREDVGMKIEKCSWGWRAEQDGIEAIYLPTVAHYRAMTLNPRVIGFCRSSLRAFDVVHFYGLYDLLGPAVSFFCRRHGIPYVIEPMGMNRPIERSIPLKRLWHRSVGGAFWQNATKIVATSELEQRELIEDRVSPLKVVVRHNGVDLASDRAKFPRGSFRMKQGISMNEPLILFLSRLIPRKGADILIQAFSKACPESGYLVIAGPEGEPDYLAFLQKCALESGVARRVVFVGPLYEDEKKAVLADADLFVLPSRYENFANVVAEAIAYDIPVIISPSCGIRPLVEGRAGLVVSPDPDALSSALDRLIQDKSLYKRLQEGCEEVTAQLSWDHLTQQMERYYVETLASQNGIH
jgi:glycosyltransferase involved in cell wall biosynthesis